MDLPRELYQYFSFDNGYKFLDELKLPLSSFSDFNDPFECLPKSEHSSILMSKSSEEIKKLIKEKEQNNVSDFNIKEQITAIEQYLEALEEIKLSCFSKNKDSILMWGHYGRKHTGMVISFKTEMKYHNAGSFFPVTYRSGRISVLKKTKHTLLGPKWRYDLYCSKAKCWKYEQEWRYIKYKERCTSEKTTKDNKEADFYFETIKKETINAIYLGCCMPLENYTKTIDLCKQKLPGIPVFKAYPRNRKYALRFEQIDM